MNFAAGATEVLDQRPRLRKMARITGVLYLLIILCGMYAEGFARGSLIVAGDVAQTAANIAENEGLFRSGLIADLIMVVCDVAVGVAFFVLLRSVNETLALLSAFFRLAQAAALGLNLVLLWIALSVVLNGPLDSSPNSAAQWAALFVGAHSLGYKLALVFFAFSLIIQAWLFYKSDLFPGWLAILMLLASLGYLLDTTATILMTDYARYADLFEMIVIVSALGGELTLCLYLLIRGIAKPANVASMG
ncbi:MAG: DUF4386 domain-containing protein [Leptospiraceae bacterium]|nr:DUF4386 domain-containing protein [Leptospiraceae bacterium]